MGVEITDNFRWGPPHAATSGKGSWMPRDWWDQEPPDDYDDPYPPPHEWEDPQDAPLDAPGAPHGDDDETDDTPASWAPVDLTAILDGTHDPIKPTLFPRSDGVCLLYPGLTHSFHGESESGKSLLAQIEAVRLIEDGKRVLYIDFESDAASVAMRLQEFGASRASIVERFTYLNPEVKPESVKELSAWIDVLKVRYDLAVIDGVTDALGIWGCSIQDNDDIAKWCRDMPNKIAKRTGAAVTMIDHVTKNADTRGRFAIGGQAKLAGLTGAGYTIEANPPLGRGRVGTIIVRVGKDRPGFVRGHGGDPRASDRTQEVARIAVDSTGSVPLVVVDGPLDPDAVAAYRLTGFMEKLSRELEQATEPKSEAALLKLVPGKESAKVAALKSLVEEGFVSMHIGARNAKLHTSIKPYRQSDDPESGRAA